MSRFLAAQLRRRRARMLGLFAAILVAAGSFVLLSASTRTSQIRVRGSLGRNFRTAYDILVRPKGSFTTLEREQGLVRDNYLSGIFGGITMNQYAQIRHLPGVEVAAPIANIGYVLPSGHFPVTIDRLLNHDATQLYRINFSYVADDGLSQYPAGSAYVYYSRVDRFEASPSRFGFNGLALPKLIQPIPICAGFGASMPTNIAGPFNLLQDLSLSCFSGKTPSVNLNTFGAKLNGVGTFWDASFPVFVSAIDPVEEAKLLHLDKAVVSGRYLSPTDGPKIAGHLRTVPILVSSRSFTSEQLQITIARLKAPALSHAALLRVLAAGTCMLPQGQGQCPSADIWTAPKSSQYRNAYQLFRSLPAKVISRRNVNFSPVYRRMLGGAFEYHALLEISGFWSTSPVVYKTVGKDHLQPTPTTNPISVWTNKLQGPANGGYYQAPPDNRDTQFRRLKEAVGNNLTPGGVLNTPALKVVGRFDPNKLPGFSPLSRVPLETYYPPTLTPKGGISRGLLGGHDLLPSQNVGGYIEQPPLFLTTLAGMRAFFNSHFFNGVSKRELRAPISVIRVRVAGVTGPNALSRKRIDTVATLIHDGTGLDVDVTAGSSPHPLTVSLPAGKFGRPALTLAEGWVKKGVSVSFLSALDRKDLALFSLILIACGIFLANGAFAVVRTRRTEIGTLLTLGWSSAEVFKVILTELLAVGAAAGAAGFGMVVIIARLSSLKVSLGQAAEVVPIALVLSAVAGLIPAWRASRLLPLDSVRPNVAAGSRRKSARSLFGMAWINLWRLPLRTLLGASGLVIGVAGFTVLFAIERAFRGVLVGTLLGNAISVQVRGVDFLALALVAALAALSVADVLYLNLRERAAELVTLETLGWSGRELRTLIVIEAAGLGLCAGLAGAVVGTAISTEGLNVPVWPTVEAALLACLAAILAAAAASLMPLVQLANATAPAVLTEE